MDKKGSPVVASKPVLLYSLRHPQLSLTGPIAVSLEYDPDGNQVVAYAYDLEVFGYGGTELEALADLRRTVVHLYLELRNSQDYLAGEALAVWRYLSQVVHNRTGMVDPDEEWEQ